MVQIVLQASKTGQLVSLSYLRISYHKKGQSLEAYGLKYLEECLNNSGNNYDVSFHNLRLHLKYLRGSLQKLNDKHDNSETMSLNY